MAQHLSLAWLGRSDLNGDNPSIRFPPDVRLGWGRLGQFHVGPESWQLAELRFGITVIVRII